MKIKNKLLICGIISLIGFNANAQQLVVELINSSQKQYNVTDIERITFDANGMILSKTVGDSTYMYTDVNKLLFKSSSTEFKNVDKGSKKVIVYPNPTQSIITIENIESTTNVNLFDIKGNLILNQKIIANQNNTINLNSCPKGIYILSVENQTYKITKQ